jgi:hypothetical protein
MTKAEQLIDSIVNEDYGDEKKINILMSKVRKLISIHHQYQGIAHTDVDRYRDINAAVDELDLAYSNYARGNM